MLCFPLILSAATADTLHIEKAKYVGPLAIQMPYMIDSVNGENQKMESRKLLERNLNPSFTTSKTIDYGTALDPSQSLHYFQFTLTPNRFTKTKLLISHLANYKIFVNGKEQYGTELSLLPQRYEIIIAAMTAKEAKDSFKMALITPKEASVTINATDKRPYTISDQTNGLHYSTISISPSGKYLQTVYTNIDTKGTPTYYTKLTYTSTDKVLMTFDGYAPYHWMPKSDLLYFTRKQDDRINLLTLNPLTLETKISCTSIPAGDFRIDPTENYLIYSLLDEKPKETGPLKLLCDPDDRIPGWRNRWNIYKFDLRTHVMQQLTYGHTAINLSDISSDGTKLLFTSDRHRLEALPNSLTSLYQMDLRTMQVDTLLRDTGYIANCSYSPDSNQILIKGSPACFNGIGCQVKEGQIPSMYDYQLYLFTIATRKVRAMTTNFYPSVENVQWSKHNKKIYFTANDQDCIHLYTLNPQTGKINFIDTHLDVIQRLSIATHGSRIVYFGQTSSTARTLYTCDLNGGKPQKIGDIDFEKWISNISISTVTKWKFCTERGDTIIGRYYLPKDFNHQKKYPLIVYYYGGCTPTLNTLEFHYAYQVLASLGYVVYVVQPSGTIGFGQEFSARHTNAWGQRTADDIIEGTREFCKQHQYVDTTKIGCMGASYGGFMTQYLVSHTDLFATAISHAGISNIASYWGGGYWGYSYSEAASQGSYPWNNAKLYTEQSSLFNADKIHTPLLLLHGTADTNVPTNESQQLYTALRLLGREVSYIQIEGSNHVVKDYDKRIHWQNTIFAWFNKYLKGQAEWWNEMYPSKAY